MIKQELLAAQQRPVHVLDLWAQLRFLRFAQGREHFLPLGFRRVTGQRAQVSVLNELVGRHFRIEQS